MLFIFKDNFIQKSSNSNYSKGLSSKEAKKQLEIYGHNVLKKSKKTSLVLLFLDQFKDILVIILLFSLLISVLIGETAEAIAILIVVIMNAAIGFFQEIKTEKTLEALKKIAAPTATVVRDGKAKVISAENLVPKDLILLKSGDRIPADAYVIECSEFKVDESMITGESFPVLKRAVKNLEQEDKIEDNQKIYMGTTVCAGRGKAVVYKTGMSTQMGNIASLIEDIDKDITPLQKRLNKLAKYIALICIIVCVLVGVLGIIRGEPVLSMLLSGLSLAVAAVPEGLPAVVTVSLAIGVRRMYRRKALIRKLPSVEALGCANVICSDKTGTLTENKMKVCKIFADGNTYEIVDKGNNESALCINKKYIDFKKSSELKRILEIALFCNNAGFEEESLGDPTETALMEVVRNLKFANSINLQKYIRLREIPFSSDRKMMSVIVRTPEGEIYCFTKGAADILIEKCSMLIKNGKEEVLTKEMKHILNKRNDELAADGYRVLAACYRKISKKEKNWDDVEKNLVFTGMFCIIDPPRKEVYDAIIKCKTAGIKPVMITGDHVLTAYAIGKEVGIDDEKDNIVTGKNINEMTDNELSEKVKKARIFARVLPEHKLRIVRAFKKNGNIVAMTGDGVNDAPAVKEADIGVAMGINGTDVTKEAASMVLMDDNFATIVAAIEEGRVIYSNIRKFLRYILSCNIGEVVTMFAASIIGLPVPLLPLQILWVNLVTDGLPAVSLSFEPKEKDVMKKPPIKKSDDIFAGGLMWVILIRGLIIGLSTIAVYMFILYENKDLNAARTGAFITLVLAQLIHVFECKSENRNIFCINWFNNIYLVISVLISLLMLFMVLYIPSLSAIFKTAELNYRQWIIVAVFSLLGPIFGMFITIFKLLLKKN